MTSLQFRFLDYSNRAAAFVYARLAGPRRLVNEYPLTTACESSDGKGGSITVVPASLASFEKEIDRLQFELDELRKEAQLRWAEHEARVYNLVRPTNSSATTR